MNGLREGYTTGSCAAAAAKAAVLLLAGLEMDKSISIPVPPEAVSKEFRRIDIPVNKIFSQKYSARVSAIKDGGDDPDATHGASIEAQVDFLEGQNPFEIKLEGGTGVGRATLPGLPVEIGQAAINPAPKAQILAAVGEALQVIKGMDSLSCFNHGILRILIEVPEGEAIAVKTMNPRLGIVGGISILGTQGIVRPFSHSSFKASISMGLDVAYACGHRHIAFATGRRSERLFSEFFPNFDENSIIQAADFFEYSVTAASRKGFTKIYWSLFFGKLVKHSQGFPYTHAKDWKINFTELSEWSSDCGISYEICKQIAVANTARQVLEMIKDLPESMYLYALLTKKAITAAQDFCRRSNNPIPFVGYCLFDFDGSIIFNGSDMN